MDTERQSAYENAYHRMERAFADIVKITQDDRVHRIIVNCDREVDDYFTREGDPRIRLAEKA